MHIFFSKSEFLEAIDDWLNKKCMRRITSDKDAAVEGYELEVEVKPNITEPYYKSYNPPVTVRHGVNVIGERPLDPGNTLLERLEKDKRTTSGGPVSVLEEVPTTTSDCTVIVSE